MSMDSFSKLKVVSLSTTPATPSPPADVCPKVSLSSSSSGSSSFLIRAPLTIDSDDEYSASTNPLKNGSSSYGSDSGIESEGFLSGEDVLDFDSQRPSVAYPDDDSSEETSGDEEFRVSRPFITDPDEEIIEESSNVEEIVISGPFDSNPDRIIKERRIISRPFVVNTNEDTPIVPSEEDDDNDSGVETAVEDSKILSLPKPGMPPVAQLSRDSDEDSIGSVVEEDYEISCVARIPGLGTSEELSTPKVQVLGVEEGDKVEAEPQFEAILEPEVDEISISGEVLDGIVGKDSVKTVLDEADALDTTEGAKYTYPVESEVSLSLESSVRDEDVKHPDEGIQALENLERVTVLYEATGMNVDYDTSLEREGEMAVGGIHDKDMVDDLDAVDTGNIDEEKSVIYFAIDSPSLEADNNVGSSNEVDIVVDEMGVIENPFEIVDEEIVHNIGQEDIHNQSGDVALDSDITYSANEETSEVDKNVNLDAPWLNDLQHENNVLDVNENIILGHESKNKKLEMIIKQENDLWNGHTPGSTEGGLMEDELRGKANILDPVSIGFDSDNYLELENITGADSDLVRLKEREINSGSDDVVKDLTFGEFETVKNVVSEVEQEYTSASFLDGKRSHDHSPRVGETIAACSDSDVDIFGKYGNETLFDSAKFTALLNATKNLWAAKLDSKNISCVEEKQQLQIQQIKTKYLRLVQRLDKSTEDSIVAQVLFLVDRATGRLSSPNTSNESAKRTAVEFEADNKNDLDFSLNILIIGKSGVGKSATINSIFGEEKAMVDPFGPATTNVKEIVGTIDGIKVRVLDTPGLRSSLKDQPVNKKILKSIGRFTKKCPPDVVIYVDRLDIQTRDHNDLPLLRTITSYLSPSIWQKCIIALTHAASTPPDGSSGSPIGYEVLVAQRSRVVQQLIRHVVGDQHLIYTGLMNPVCLVENSRLSKKNGDAHILLPNGETWKSQLLLLCYSVKILSEVDTIAKAQVPLNHNKHFGFQVPSPPLPYFLSSLSQSCAHPKLYADQFRENVDSDIELGGPSESDQEDKDCDQLPSLKPCSARTGPNNHGWDHDLGYNGVSLKQNLLVPNWSATAIVTQITKDRKVFDFHAESSVSARHCENRSTMLGFNNQTIGEHFAYVLKGETKTESFGSNKTDTGVTIIFFGEDVFSGLKIEERIAVGKRLILVGSSGAIQSQEDGAYGANLEVRLRRKDYPVEKDQTTAGLSLTQWRGDLIWGCNIKSQFSVGRNSKMALHAGLNSKGSGKISVKTSNSEQLQIALVGLLPVAHAIFRNFFPSLGKKY